MRLQYSTRTPEYWSLAFPPLFSVGHNRDYKKHGYAHLLSGAKQWLPVESIREIIPLTDLDHIGRIINQIKLQICSRQVRDYLQLGKTFDLDFFFIEMNGFEYYFLY